MEQNVMFWRDVTKNDKRWTRREERRTRSLKWSAKTVNKAVTEAFWLEIWLQKFSLRTIEITGELEIGYLHILENQSFRHLSFLKAPKWSDFLIWRTQTKTRTKIKSLLVRFYIRRSSGKPLLRHSVLN